MKHVLITGTTGYIATALVQWLSKFPEHYCVQTISLRNHDWKTKSFSGYNVVIHAAGLAHTKATKENLSDFYQINRDLTIEVAEKAKTDGVKQFIFLSSMSVYGMDKGIITADTLPAPSSDYGKSKLQAELALQALESPVFKISVLRPPMVYGKGCPGNYATLSKLAQKLPVFPRLSNQRSMVFIDTLCEFIRKLIDDNSSGLFFPQNSNYVCTSDMVELIAAAHGKQIHTTKLLTPFARLATHLIPQAKKAFGTLIYDFSPVSSIQESSFAEGIYRTELPEATLLSPFISIVMPAYNAERYIQDAIESVIAQTYTNFELIVVDDCSKDQTAAIVRSLVKNDPRIILLQNQQNSGASASRNRAISCAKGDWIAFLDSDDMWRKDKLEQQIRLLRWKPDAHLIYTASAFMDENGNRFSHVMQARSLTTRSMLLKGNIISCSSVLVRKADMLKYPMAGDKMHEDYVTWLQILKETPYAYGINEPLLIYRLSNNSKSSNRIKSAKMLYRSYRHIGYSTLHTALMVLHYTWYSVRKRQKIHCTC